MTPADTTIPVIKPPYPAKVTAFKPSTGIVIVTPDRAEEWNAEVRDGKRLPYVYYGFSESDYLSFAQWLQEVLRYLEQQKLILEYYEEVLKLNNKNKEDTDNES